MICSNCGSQINRKQQFCTNCGQEINLTSFKIVTVVLVAILTFLFCFTPFLVAWAPIFILLLLFPAVIVLTKSENEILSLNSFLQKIGITVLAGVLIWLIFICLNMFFYRALIWVQMGLEFALICILVENRYELLRFFVKNYNYYFNKDK